MGLLSNKAVVVTGAGRGIGRAVARLFAKEGARVLVNDVGCDARGDGADPSVARAVADEIRADGGTAVEDHGSCATAEGAARIVEAAIAAFGGVDTLCHVAGVAGDQPLLRVDDATLRRVLDVQVVGALFAMRAAAAHMQRAGGGRIVLTTSAAGLIGNYGQPAYSAAAAGTYGLMRAASIELQRHDVYVNAVAPIAKTRLTEALPMFEHVSTMTPEHVAPAYVFFGSALSGDQTGNVMSVAGGRLSLFKIQESSGRFKEADGGVWTADEIRDHWISVGKP